MNQGVQVEFTGVDGKKDYGTYVDDRHVTVYARDIRQVPVTGYSDYDVYRSFMDSLEEEWYEHEDMWRNKSVTIEGIEMLEGCDTYGEVYDALKCDRNKFIALLEFVGLKKEFFSFSDCAEPDTEDYNIAWECFMERLGELLEELIGEKTGKVLVLGSNLDWRGRSGYQFIDMQGMEAKDLVSKLAPNSDFSVSVYDDKDGELGFSFSHHDCPMGSRMRLIPVERIVGELLSEEELRNFMVTYLSDEYCDADERVIYEKVLDMGISGSDNCVMEVLDNLDVDDLKKVLLYLFDEGLIDSSYEGVIAKFLM